MASKCWFVLRQTHYPPPSLPHNGTGPVCGSGPITLGHIIPDLRHLDNVLNYHGPLDIPPNTPIYPTKAWNLTWDAKNTKGVNVSVSSGIPIAAALGVTVKLDAGAAFKQTINNCWEFESLETYIFQPTAEYIEDSMEDEDVAAYLSNRGLLRSASTFMITGIIVARGAKVNTSNGASRDTSGGPGLEVPSIAEVSVSINMLKETEITATAQKTTDFVWAIRLVKISKGLIDRRWSHETFSSGATFGLNEGQESGQRIIDALEIEGFKEVEMVDFTEAEDVFVITSDSSDAIKED